MSEGIDEQRLESRKFQGIPSIAISESGRLWATWYASKTPGEDDNNYVVISTSNDGGKSWSETEIINPDNEGPLRAFDPEIWIDPNGKLWSFWAETIGHDGTIAKLWTMTKENPNQKDSEWSEPRIIANGIMMCKPTVLSTGEWLFPVSTWRGTKNSAKVIVSKDEGKTFKIKGTVDVPIDVQNYDEHIIIEKKNKSLWMLVRTKYGIGESISEDFGETWSNLKPSTIKHTTSRFFMRRLSSGNLLLVKHGGINERGRRSHLTAYLSKDDGTAWSNGLLLDERLGVSYPDGQQSSDGIIHIIYDYSRTEEKEILLAKFTEDDVMLGDSTSESISLKMVVSSNPSIKLNVLDKSMYFLTDGKSNGIRAEFFNNKNLTGKPIASRIDKSINFYWAENESPIPGIVNDDEFSVRWSGKIKSPDDGEYILGVKADNGVKLFINNELLIDEWHNKYPSQYITTSYKFEEGKLYNIIVEFYENKGTSEIVLGIAPKNNK
jgi:predicted neuraminidase